VRCSGVNSSPAPASARGHGKILVSSHENPSGGNLKNSAAKKFVSPACRTPRGALRQQRRYRRAIAADMPDLILIEPFQSEIALLAAKAAARHKA